MVDSAHSHTFPGTHLVLPGPGVLAPLLRITSWGQLWHLCGLVTRFGLYSRQLGTDAARERLRGLSGKKEGAAEREKPWPV